MSNSSEVIIANRSYSKTASGGGLPGPDEGGKIYFGNLEVDRPNVSALIAVNLLVIISLIVTLHVKFYLPQGSQVENDEVAPPVLFEVNTAEDMISLLKGNNLWETDDIGSVPPLLFASYPDNLDQLDTDVKKKVFFHGLLPVALTALKEIREEKKALKAILDRFDGGYKDIVFSNDYAVWGRVLTSDEIDFIFALTRKYRTRSAVELARRVDVLPLSMIMAQAAIESSWATSRFAREGNNLFGVWTWGGKGIVPGSRDEGKNHKVAAYDSILESVRAYILTINRVPAYKNLRMTRRYTLNPLKLAEGLVFYSQRREHYVLEVKDVIKFNDLMRFDNSLLDDRPVEYQENQLLELTMQEKDNLG